MSEFTLVSHPLCPYVQRAAIALTEKGLAFRRIDIDLAAKPEWFLRLSPLGKTPLLAVGPLEEATVIFESAVILEYLEDTVTPALHPGDPLERARHRGWIEIASQALNGIAGLYSARDERAFAEKAVALRALFQRVEGALGEGPWFAGAAFSLVDAAFGPVFRYFDVFDGLTDHGILEGLPRVGAWREELAARPSVRGAVGADYPARLRAFLAARPGPLGVKAAA